MRQAANLACMTSRRPRNGGRTAITAIVTVLAALVLVPTQLFAQGATTTRPISDFLSTQGTLCVAHPGACPNFVGTYVAWTAPGSGRIAAIDYAGKESVAGQLGTSTNGTVTERPLFDGRVQVRVHLLTRNALAYVQAWDGSANFNAGAFLFGHTAAEIQAGAASGVGDSSLDVTFNNSGPGAPLPDLVRFTTPDPAFALPIQDLTMIAFQSGASGPLRPAFGVADGTPGRAAVVQSGLIGTAFTQGFKGRLYDAFPAERVDLSVVGR